MRRTKNWIHGIALFAMFCIVLNACDNPGKNTEVEAQSSEMDKMDKQRFPNERSELAILMRNLIEDLEANRDLVAKGEKPTLNWVEKYDNLLTATPTDSKDSGPVFHGFGTKFLSDLQQFQDADTSNQVEVYNALIQSCIDCHMQHCQGPIPAIKKLRL